MRSLLLIFLLGQPFLWAQSDLTLNDIYQIGDEATYLVVDATGLDPGPAGLNVTWDYSNLPRIPAEDHTTRYAAASEAPNPGLFPDANMIAIDDAGETDAYSFFFSGNGIFSLEGLDIPDLGVVTYSDKTVTNFPLVYNQTQTDDFVGMYTANVNGIQVTTNRTGSLTTFYDGFGTLILPNGTSVSNVRRIRFDQTVRDEVTVSGTTIVTEVVTETYNFFAEGDTRHIFHLTYGTSTVTPPGISVDSVQASYIEVNGNGGGGGGSTFAPRGTHLTTQGGDFNTEVLVRNPTQSAQTLSLTPYDGSGTAGTPVEVNLAAGATSRVLQEDYFPASAASFSAGGCDDCVFSVGYRADIEDASTAHVHQNERYATEYQFYPGEWDYLFDGAAIVNAGTEAAHVEAIQLDDNGNVLDREDLASNLAAGAKTLAIFNTLFDNTPNTTVKIESTQPIAVMILRISNDGRFLYQNKPLPDPNTDSERWIAHITSETGGFDTDVYVTNSSGSSKTITFHPFDTNGVAQADVNVTVPGDTTQRFAKTDLFTGDTSHARITGESELLATVGYRSRVADSSTAAIHENPPVGNGFSLYPGEWNVLFDGFAIVNTGSQATSLTVTQIGDDGQVKAAEVLVESLAPNAKFVGLLEGVIPEDANATIRVEATQPLAVLALRLSKDSRYLYGNYVLPE